MLTTYQDLANSGYTGEAWNAYYEYASEDGETWGHSGEYADELDAWFTDESEAEDFFASNFSRQNLAKMLLDAVDAVSVSASLETHSFVDGADEGFDEERFVIVGREDVG